MIRQRIGRRDPSALIVSAAPSFEDDPQVPMNGAVPDKRAMQLIRATNQVKVWLQLRALSQGPQAATLAPEGEEVTL